MMDADACLLDTNVLLAATDMGRPSHEAALAVLNLWPSEGRALAVSGQILREYLAVTTRPRTVNGLRLSAQAALGNVDAFLQRTRLLPEDGRVAAILRRLIAEVPCLGEQVHDANVVATMVTHGVGELVTSHIEHVRRFEPRIRLSAPGVPGP